MSFCFHYYSVPNVIVMAFMPKGLFYGVIAFPGEVQASALCWSQIDNDLSSLVPTIEGLPGNIDFIAIDILTAACVAIAEDAMWSTRLQAFTRRWITDLTKVAVPPLPIQVIVYMAVYVFLLH